MTTPARAIRVALVTNIPAPYRLPVYELLAANPEIDLKVYFCSGREPDREWDLGESRFEKVNLRERFFRLKGRFIHINPDVWGALKAFGPDVVVTTGFNPTHLIAYLFARFHRARHIAMTDGTFMSEIELSGVHRWVRRRVYAGSQAFVGASDGSFELYQSYDIDARLVFKSHLCANNVAFLNAPQVEKRFDFIFCGRFTAIKSPLFAIEIAHQVAKRLGRRSSIVLVGSGDMDAEMRAAADAVADDVEVVFAGFARQDALPQHYGSARILLFPTQWDPWGVVANEACAAGLPVLVTPAAGSSGELIRNGQNGFVMPLDIQQWTSAAVRLLSDSDLYRTMSMNSAEIVKEYSFENAAIGIAKAVKMSLGNVEQVQPRAFKRPRVVIIQRRMTHYRVPLFDLLRKKLDEAGIQLIVAFGDPTLTEQRKADSASLSWGVHVPTKYILNGLLCWQNAWGVIQGADLVVITQENKLLFNHLLMFGKRRFRLAFWGHGRNFQVGRSVSLSETVKRWIARRTDWWFAYTDASARVVCESGFDANKITVLNNTINTNSLQEDLNSLSLSEIEASKRTLGIGPGPVAIVLCSLYPDKRLGFLVEAAQAIHAEVPGFQLLVVGDGPDRSILEQAAVRSGGWLHYLGARKGREKALFLAMSKVMLNPGMVGLGVLDSFVAGVPMVTTDCGIHSPEIAYLKSDFNGLMTADTLLAYKDGVLRLLNDDILYSRIQEQCRNSAKDKTLENMADRFCEGIQRSLSWNDASDPAGGGT